MKDSLESATKRIRLSDQQDPSEMAASARPFASVTFVCRSCPGIDAISDIVWKIDSFLDPASLWSLTTACSVQPAGVLRLLPRIAALKDPHMDIFERRQQFSRALDRVCSCSKPSLPVVQWLIEEYLPTGSVAYQIEKLASVSSGLNVLQWLHANHNSRVVWRKEALSCAVKNNQLETLKWLYETIFRSDFDVSTMFYQSVWHGNVEMTKWLFHLDSSEKTLTMDQVSRRGQVEMVEWAMERSNFEINDFAMDQAICYGQTELAKWLYSKFSISTVGVPSVAGATIDGYFELVEWALQHLELLKSDESEDEEFPNGDEALQHQSCIAEFAALKGQFGVLERLHEVSDECWDDTVMGMAVEGGFLDIVKWLHENRTDGCSTAAMDSAARNGNLELVQWLHENRTEGCSTGAMDKAAASGHMEIVQYLHEHRTEGCTTRAMDDAAQRGHLRMVVWLHQNRSEGCTTRVLELAAESGHLDVVKWLHANRGASFRVQLITRVASNDNVELLQWFLCHYPGKELDIDVMEDPARNGNLPVLKTLLADGRCKLSMPVVLGALSSKQFDVVDWLKHYYPQRFAVFMPEIARSETSPDSNAAQWRQYTGEQAAAWWVRSGTVQPYQSLRVNRIPHAYDRHRGTTIVRPAR